MAVGEVFASKTGNQIVHTFSSGLAHDTSREPSQTSGWREGPDGSREKVRYYVGYGWYTDDELFKARQENPRYAP